MYPVMARRTDGSSVIKIAFQVWPARAWCDVMRVVVFFVALAAATAAMIVAVTNRLTPNSISAQDLITLGSCGL